MQQTFRGKPLILGAYTVALIAVAPLVWLILRTDPDWLLVGFVVAGGIAAVLAWPRKIAIDEKTISQRTFFGSLQRLPLQDVDSIAGSIRQGCVTVSGPGAEVRHTWWHSGREEFVYLIEELTDKNIFWGDA